ncbi:hypothetical protein J7T55_001220 [Diaporthe amygdali]|uniref:uncharacterized protein n=1 Tax=Phomopsis amygdali TaxID=1214568 RepID=UPI0022FECA3B|nr:uncharacterized protein J7T55_001220 [Diaporthe amygdali]KAJ0103764.1 hypothetical protein J7T55_001220 [Diaporthe amygdali]
MQRKNVVDDSMVYVAFNSIFQGQDSQIRKLSPIKKLVHKHQKQPQVAQLLQEYGAPAIYEKLQRLLSGQVFESTLKAKCEFPELFEVSRAQSAERAISEAEAAAGHAKAVEEALDSTDRYGLPYESNSNNGRTGTDPQAQASTGSPAERQSARQRIHVPSLFPLEFDFTTSYKILVRTQEVLELACFRFAEKAMPEILEKRKWHCPESAELNLWATEFLKRLVRFEKRPSTAVSPPRRLEELFPSIAQIRHHTVHRIPVTAKELEQFMADGETLVQLFEDYVTIAVMSRARSEVHMAATEMENRKTMLEARLTKILQDVADKRAELDRAEAEAIADTQRKDKENQSFANAYLQEAIWVDDGAIGKGPFATRSPTANGIDNDFLLDQLDNAMESEIAPNEEDATKALALPSALDESFISNSDGDSVVEEK